MKPKTLWKLLGISPDLIAVDSASTLSIKEQSGIIVEEVELIISGLKIKGTITKPYDINDIQSEIKQNFPTILYCHAHGNRYDIGRSELLNGNSTLQSPAYGQALANLGYLTLCIDMPCFGERQQQTEDSLSKSCLWLGTTLIGEMLKELAAAVSYLVSRDDVDSSRLATLGMSMGATHAYWLAALDNRIKVVAHLCVFSNFSSLIISDSHNEHGHYLTVPGLLTEYDAGDIAGMIAPRPQLICIGEQDVLTPSQAFSPALKTVFSAYEQCGKDNLKFVLSKETAHVETEYFRQTVLEFLHKHL